MAKSCYIWTDLSWPVRFSSPFSGAILTSRNLLAVTKGVLAQNISNLLRAGFRFVRLGDHQPQGLPPFFPRPSNLNTISNAPPVRRSCENDPPGNAGFPLKGMGDWADHPMIYSASHYLLWITPKIENGCANYWEYDCFIKQAWTISSNHLIARDHRLGSSSDDLVGRCRWGASLLMAISDADWKKSCMIDPICHSYKW